ncbi:MAG: ribonuclease J, partial [bacterium]|nr:ribonuclease J [bacterium]
MKTNVEIAKELGYIKASMKTFIPIDKISDYPDDKIVIICTGAQGERNAALMRIASDEHRSVTIQPNDTLIFSSSVIPGNERSVQRLKDILYRKRANVIHYNMMDVHAGGHAHKEDIKLMLSLFKPKYYVPIEGNHFLLRENAEVAYSVGWEENKVFVPDNGQVMEFTRSTRQGELGEGRLTEERLPTDYVFVDGLGVGDVSQVVLRDRQALAEDGMVVVIVQIARKTGKLVASPDIVSRGFIFMKENRELIEKTRDQVKKMVVEHKSQKGVTDIDHIKNTIRNDVGSFLFQKTERRPMILPVVIEV